MSPGVYKLKGGGGGGLRINLIDELLIKYLLYLHMQQSRKIHIWYSMLYHRTDVFLEHLFLDKLLVIL